MGRVSPHLSEGGGFEVLAGGWPGGLRSFCVRRHRQMASYIRCINESLPIVCKIVIKCGVVTYSLGSNTGPSDSNDSL